MEPLPSVVSP
jgi:tRNA pseudouridine38/39 synthase